MTEQISSLDFKTLIATETKPVLIDVYGDRCPPCRAIAPVIDEMAAALAGEARIVKINRDEADANGGENNALLKFLAEKKIRGIPALLLFENGVFKDAITGGPRSRANVQGWMETQLGRAFSSPATNPLARFGIELKSGIETSAARLAMANQFMADLSPALLTLSKDGELGTIGLDRMIENNENYCFYFESTRRVAQAMANEFPNLAFVDTKGRRINPEPSVRNAQPGPQP